MNKAELVDAVASAANLSKADAGRAVDAVVGSIASSLSNGEQVAVVGFGTFSVKHRAARAGRWPASTRRAGLASTSSPAGAALSAGLA